MFARPWREEMLAFSACSASAPKKDMAQSEIDPLARLVIEVVEARSARDAPIATVPGTVTLPPEARVAVTATFSGATGNGQAVIFSGLKAGEKVAVSSAAELKAMGAELSEMLRLFIEKALSFRMAVIGLAALLAGVGVLVDIRSNGRGTCLFWYQGHRSRKS